MPENEVDLGESQVKALAELARDRRVDEYVLDDIVHDVASKYASDSNNAGVEGQIRALLTLGMTVDEVRDTIKGCA